MTTTSEHIISLAREHLGDNNVIAIWKSTHRSDMYDINYYYVIVRNAQNLGIDNSLTADFLLSVNATAKLGEITEIYFGTENNHIELADDDCVIFSVIDDLSNYKTSNSPQLEYRDQKGQYDINTQVSSLLAKKHETYDQCFEILRPRFEDEHDTMYGTCRMLFYMYEHLPKKIVLDWFSHETPLMKQLRHSSPFSAGLKYIDKSEYDNTIHYVVNNPEKFPPRPGYDWWLQDLLDKGGIHINNYTQRYIPDDILETVEIHYLGQDF